MFLNWSFLVQFANFKVLQKAAWMLYISHVYQYRAWATKNTQTIIASSYANPITDEKVWLILNAPLSWWQCSHWADIWFQAQAQAHQSKELPPPPPPPPMEEEKSMTARVRSLFQPNLRGVDVIRRPQGHTTDNINGKENDLVTCYCYSPVAACCLDCISWHPGCWSPAEAAIFPRKLLVRWCHLVVFLYVWRGRVSF